MHLSHVARFFLSSTLIGRRCVCANEWARWRAAQFFTTGRGLPYDGSLNNLFDRRELLRFFHFPPSCSCRIKPRGPFQFKRWIAMFLHAVHVPPALAISRTVVQSDKSYAETATCTSALHATKKRPSRTSRTIKWRKETAVDVEPARVSQQAL